MQNKKTIIALKILLVISVLFLLYVVALLYVTLNKAEPQNTWPPAIPLSDDTTPEQHPLDRENRKPIVSDVNLADVKWTRYMNERYRISFFYPEDFVITEEEVKHTYEDGKEWYHIFFDSNARRQYARFSMDVNPDGIGPFFIDKRYIVEKKGNGGIVISSIVDTTDPLALNDDIIWSSAYFQGNENAFQFHFIYEMTKESDKIDYDAMFIEILESMQVR